MRISLILLRKVDKLLSNIEVYTVISKNICASYYTITSIYMPSKSIRFLLLLILSEQLAEIRKASLAKLLCNTGDNLEEIQTQAFKVISPRNPLMCCNALPEMDLSPWQELEYH